VATAWIHPNWHVVLVHYPLALLSLGLGIEVLGCVARRPGTLRAAGRWMVLLGGLSCWPAAMSGVYAYYDVVRQAAAEDVGGAAPVNEPWYRLTREASARLSVEQREDMEHHIWRAAGGTVLISVGIVVFLGSSDRWRRRLYVPLLLWMLLSTGVMVWGAWYAGESVYARGTAVGHRAEESPRVQAHVVLAGLTIAAAVGALGMSVRAVTGRARAESVANARESHDVAYADSRAVQVRMTVVGERAGAGRFWLVAGVLGAGTVAAGMWVASAWTVEALGALAAQPRTLAHMVLGSAIVVLMIVLAGLGRWGRGRRGWLATCAAALLLCIAAQVWVGILLLYAGWGGGASLVEFQRPIVQGK
jgi:hypothetical protein